ncbi:MAG TPA: hypothetical protein QF611_15745 [Pseudomonadales bacterium]|jgi:predicted methyltransferase|nr:methyltransferase type 11 [Gammaproteobacteria bacterium]MDP6027141.1 hypothetical protein [Pseudomonadales bacterium]MDP6314615.1 hypothetical protein [Pseudomonadales bacterium]MDP7313404.1 hypothetical protein [Pseudomonadales bacterium]HJP52483.1 hypothetical protein [Pseudomonadales bacterium]|tara:strand:+ start:1693 stop:2436 length:744 start_codon:yes stop_codon:yes gene_type:complete
MKKTILRIVLLLGFALTVYGDTIDDAVANPGRPAADTQDDAGRKPADILRFFQIKPGMAVFDIFAGGGYYSELLSYVVGSEGHVVLYNNNPWNSFVGKAVDTRLADGRLPNVSRNTSTPDSLVDLDSQYDTAIFVLGMHDIYYADPGNGWLAIDREKFLKGIYGLVKSGGVLGIIDHNGAQGADSEKISKELHRIDPAVIIRDLEAVGFTLEASSDVLRNENDVLTTSVFTPENKRKTDRSVLRFRK